MKPRLMVIPPSRGVAYGPRTLGLVCILGAVCLVIAAPTAIGQATQDASVQDAELIDGKEISGRLERGADGRFRFQPDQVDSEAISISDIFAIRFDKEDGSGETTAVVSAFPPWFQVQLDHDERLFGDLIEIDDTQILFDLGLKQEPLAIKKSGIMSLRQSPEAVVVFDDRFDQSLRSEWRLEGGITLRPQNQDEVEEALVVPATTGKATLWLNEPVSVGTAFVRFGANPNAPKETRWLVRFVFRSDSDPLEIGVRIPTIGEIVELIEPTEPSLSTQPITLPGSDSVLKLKIGAERVQLSVAGAILAQGSPPDGALVGISIETEEEFREPATTEILAAIDAIRVIQEVSTPEDLLPDPSQDSVTLINGDQLWGEARYGDKTTGVGLAIYEHVTVFPWSNVLQLDFERRGKLSRVIEGPIARVEWQHVPGWPLNQSEGAIVDFNDTELVLETPYAGQLTIPRTSISRIELRGEGTRIVLDPFPRHLGDQVMPDLDPLLPEGDHLEFEIDREMIPGHPAELVLDVVQVEGMYVGASRAADLRRGDLRTLVLLNGESIDFLNRYITKSNSDPARIRIPIPQNALRDGVNQFRIQQVGKADQPEYRDDLGILGIAIEVPGTP